MKITLRLFAILRERVGVSQLSFQLPDAATLAEARDALLEQHPNLTGLIERAAYAVNRNYAPINTPLHEGDEVAIIPPVSGG